MMRRAVISIAVLFLASCSKDEPKIDAGRMLPIIIELHMADAYSTEVRDTFHPNHEKNFDSLAVWTLRILAKNKVSQEDFNASMDWYRDHPEVLKTLYEKAADSLERVTK